MALFLSRIGDSVGSAPSQGAGVGGRVNAAGDSPPKYKLFHRAFQSVSSKRLNGNPFKSLSRIFSSTRANA